MERIGQTKRRQADDGEEQGEQIKRRRRNGNDTVEYLREKAQVEKALKEKEIEMKQMELEMQRKKLSDSQNQMADMQQQQQQTKAMQAAMLAQQQQQGNVMLSLIENLTKIKQN